jgi:CRP-like cAMP-binding protein
MAVLLGGVRSADVVALTALEAVRLMARPFRELLHEDARLALALARLQAERLKGLNQRFLLRGADAMTRLLAVLLDLAERCSAGRDPLALIPPLPQRELAAMAGLSRETTSRSFSQLRQRGLLQADGEGMRLLELDPLRRRGLWH